jgi:hypothetical protein
LDIKRRVARARPRFQNPFSFFPSRVSFFARKNAMRNASIHATDENDIRDRFCDKEVSVRRKTHVSSGPGGFVSPVRSTFLRHDDFSL